MALIQPSEVITGGVNRPAPADIRLDPGQVSAHLDVAEYRWVMPVLGASFYGVLVNAKGTSTAFSSTAYQALWTTRLKSLCAISVLYEAAPYMVAQAGTNGLYYLNNEYGENVGAEGLKMYQDNLKSRIEVEQRMLKDWLCASAAALPGFNASAAGCPGDCGNEIEEAYNLGGFIL